MYLSEKQHPIDFGDREMMIEVVENGGLQPQQLPQQQQQQQQQQPQQMMFGESSGEEHEVKAPKKRAETWAQEEIRSLINLRREIDYLFNTTKSNRHLWEQISSKMREKGFDRSPTMCTDKWRNLLKEFKKAKHHARGSGSAKMSYYKEIAEILRERNKNAAYKSPPPSKVDPYIRFSSDKDYFEDADINSGSCLTRESFYLGLDDTSISFGHMEASGRSTLNLERRLDHDGHPLAITEADAVGTNGVNPWNWREASGNGGDSTSYDGRVITVKWGEFTRRIGIDGAADAIKEAIKSGFGLRTRRAFWLEDENEVIRSLDREMPLGTYTLHLDDGITIKVCSYDESDRLPVPTDEKTFYTEEELHEFLNRRGWACLRELSGFRSVDTMEELRPGEMYQGVVRMLAE